MAKSFTKFGLKRDNNLLDIPNKEQALNNLLRDLRGNKPSFTLEDLECIQELFPKGITNGDFRKLADIAVKFLTTEDSEDLPPGSKVAFDPLITLENRFDRAYFTVSDPFFYGGDGPTARYYDNDQILRATPGSPTSNFTGFSGDPVRVDTKWEIGNFAYSNKITSEFISLYGAVQWSGYFKPKVSGIHQFSINTTGFYKFEFDDGSGNFEFTFDPTTGTYDYNNNNFGAGFITLIDETKTNSNLNIISVNQSGVSSTLSQQIGDSRGRTITIPYPLAEWRAYKIRITYFIDEISIPNPEENLFSIQKVFDINLNDPQGGGQNLNFKQLYDETYFDNYIIGDFKDYVDKSIYFGGTKIGTRGTIGDSSTTPGQNYVNLSSFSPVTTVYTPPKTTTNILNTKSNCTYTNSNSIISFGGNDANKTEGIELGNYVIGAGIPDNTRVQEIIINNSVILDKTPTSSVTAGSLTFVNHRGFVGTGICNTASGSNSITSVSNVTNPADIEPGMVVVSAAYTGSDFVRIISYSGSTVTLTRNMGSTLNNTRFYVYYDTGLVNQSLKVFCQGVLAKRVVQPVGQLAQNDYTYNPGSTVLTLNDVSGLSTGMYVHLYPATPHEIVDVNGVDEIRSLATITNINTTDRTITISTGLSASITYTPATITNMTFTPAGVNINKEVCFVPSDTSPPFSANAEGLTTSQDVRLVSSYEGSANTSSEVVYDKLSITCSPAQVIQTTPSDTVTHILPIVDRNNVTYHLLLGS
jgi:hypothetical protein